MRGWHVVPPTPGIIPDQLLPIHQRRLSPAPPPPPLALFLYFLLMTWSFTWALDIGALMWNISDNIAVKSTSKQRKRVLQMSLYQTDICFTTVIHHFATSFFLITKAASSIYCHTRALWHRIFQVARLTHLLEWSRDRDKPLWRHREVKHRSQRRQLPGGTRSKSPPLDSRRWHPCLILSRFIYVNILYHI